MCALFLLVWPQAGRLSIGCVVNDMQQVGCHCVTSSVCVCFAICVCFVCLGLLLCVGFRHYHLFHLHCVCVLWLCRAGFTNSFDVGKTAFC